MNEATRKYYEKRGALLVKNLKSRHFDAYYCANKEEALAKALELIPEGVSVGWNFAESHCFDFLHLKQIISSPHEPPCLRGVLQVVHTGCRLLMLYFPSQSFSYVHSQEYPNK